jgi:hypothetical protein
MKHTSALITASAAFLAACGTDGLGPQLGSLAQGPQLGSLRLDASIGRSTIGFGDTTSIVFRLRNLGSDSIVLSFSNSCQVLPYITTPRPDEVVHPGGGSWGCYQALTSLALGPGAEHVTSVLVRGGAQASYPAIVLLPGEYRAYARLEHRDFPLRSATIAFRVD